MEKRRQEKPGSVSASLRSLHLKQTRALDLGSPPSASTPRGIPAAAGTTPAQGGASSLPTPAKLGITWDTQLFFSSLPAPPPWPSRPHGPTLTPPHRCGVATTPDRRSRRSPRNHAGDGARELTVSHLWPPSERCRASPPHGLVISDCERERGKVGTYYKSHRLPLEN